MTGNQLRQNYLDFFATRDHQIITPAPLVPENDPTTLFTSAGMQPMMPYLLGQPHPQGNRLVDSQPSFRSQDIDEVGDNRHTTFFEMLGNWSLGDYFKKEQLTWVFEFLTQELKLPIAQLAVSVFEGNDQIPKDEEAAGIWRDLGIPHDRIFFYGVDKNWWSRSGVPANMPTGEPGGPDSEVFFEFTHVEHDPKYGPHCHPNCDCGRFLEIGNSVFMQYQKTNTGFTKLPKNNIDFGGGLERLLAATDNDPDVFKTDLFLPIIQAIEEYSKLNYSDTANQSAMRVIADHLKAATFLISQGVRPANKAQGYVLRRLIRRAVTKMRALAPTLSQQDFARQVYTTIGAIYAGVYFRPAAQEFQTSSAILIEEITKFEATLTRGLKIIKETPQITGKIAFDLLQSYGFPWELTLEIAQDKGQKVDQQEFAAEFTKHQELSRSTSKGMFKGGLADHSETVTKYHTATHLLHESLRRVLGAHVHQTGSNITGERLRFDFSHPTALTTPQIQEVEDLVNQQISANLPVSRSDVSLDEAQKMGAIGLFTQKYGDRVSVYSIGKYSLEICGGPHVAATGVIGPIEIYKQEAVGAGTRRLYARLANGGPS